ncbi:hypothetical protein C8R41DRAFT_937584 [Lentinula lateritia]|uniref:Uncharacterized protein n=1 Tax=Lentinula lateritia TaxID=40482 RepID=A0ABQ8VVF1_9AGAR|nr:hypothetical protein C8R41DRAFT_937584 [Lentinula lateritia]
MAFPLPDPDAPSEIKKLEDCEDSQTFKQVVMDLLDPICSRIEFINFGYSPKELRMAYRSISVEGFQWHLRKSAMTPLASNYILLAYSERQIIRSRPCPYKLPRSMLRNPRHVEVDKGMTAIIEELFGRPRDLSSKEKKLPPYIGSKIHPRLVDVKSRLTAVGQGDYMRLAESKSTSSVFLVSSDDVQNSDHGLGKRLICAPYWNLITSHLGLTEFSARNQPMDLVQITRR